MLTVPFLLAFIGWGTLAVYISNLPVPLRLQGAIGVALASLGALLMDRPFGLASADDVIKEDILMKQFKCTFYRPIAIISRLMFIICLILVCFATGSAAKEKAAPPAPSIETLHPKSMGEVTQLLSQLSDEQVRQILLQQLAKSLPQAHQTPGPSGWMNRLESFSILFKQRISELGRYLPKFFPDMTQILQKMTDGEGFTSLLQMFLALTVIIGLALGVERFCRRFSSGMRERFDAAPAMQGWMRFGTAVARILPDFLGIIIFSLISGLLFAVIPFSNDEGYLLLFIAVMMVIVLIRLITLLSRLIWSPHAAQLRLVPVSDATAAHIHKHLTRLAGYYAGVYVLMQFLQKLEVPMDGSFLIILVVSIPFMGMMGRILWQSRTMVAAHLRQTGQGPSGDISWFRNQLAAGWHILAMGYVAIVWFLAMVRLALYGPQRDAAFAVSFFIIPLYLIMDRAGKWLVAETLGTVRKTVDQDNSRYFTIATGLVRIVIVFTLALWLFKIFGIDLPFLDKVGESAFSILMTLFLAHVVWGLTNRYIQHKLEGLAPPPSEEQADDDEEFSGQTLDRSFTLLPMLRKFVGTVMVVMVTLIVLSSLGINITPLMAGAGVVGLALGFGSQKLVSDVLSGIFYLVDDTFRVGEYIQAGSVSGTVEGFTLRNVMLRHDKGALQIVPFSKLGAVTNYNRGGMVMKFNLNLPYDTNIEQVRKIIKKVGQKIMDDPELGPDLLLPIKSQGVKTVADSVMTFRVRFTAKFGRGGIIQRKAFELISKALADKGIHFAHRRVIVEFPPGYEKASGATPAGADPSPEAVDQLKAGAAAAMAQMLTEEEQKKMALAKKTQE
jgi:small-conductance mechanosensitive channel